MRPRHINRRTFLRGLVVGGAAAGFAASAAACGGKSSVSTVPSTTISLSQVSPSLAALYRYVEANKQTTEHIPCYCGCGQFNDHKSVHDCFVNAKGQYDDHASGCQICVDIASQVQQLAARGMDVKTIRTRIDQQFSQYGSPTNTQ